MISLSLKMFFHFDRVDCPLNCAYGKCIKTNSAQQPYACLCNGTIQFNTCGL